MKKTESRSIPIPIDAATIDEETPATAEIAEAAPRIASANRDMRQSAVEILPMSLFFFGLGFGFVALGFFTTAGSPIVIF